MRIAVLGVRSIGGDCSGGIERHVQELTTRMVARGHEVTVYCREKYNDVGKEFQGVRLVNRPAIYSKHLEAITHTAISLPSVLSGYDVVHFHATGPSLLSWGPRLVGTPTVVTVHGLDFLRAKWGLIATGVLRAGAWTSANCPSKTIVVSKVLKDHYLSTYGKETIHIPNGIVEPRHMGINMLRRFDIVEGEYVLSLGRLVPEKGIHYLIEAFRTLDTSLKLLIVGGDSHSDGYLKRLKQLAGSDSRIVFTGPLYGPAKDEAFSNAKLFVIPSEIEGMPIAMLEAMSYGCPVLASDIPECDEVIRGGREVGYSFASKDVESLRAQLMLLLKEDNLYRVGQNSKEYVLSKFDWDRITRQTLGVYDTA